MVCAPASVPYTVAQSGLVLSTTADRPAAGGLLNDSSIEAGSISSSSLDCTNGVGVAGTSNASTDAGSALEAAILGCDVNSDITISAINATRFLPLTITIPPTLNDRREPTSSTLRASAPLSVNRKCVYVLVPGA
jgi:hypothetical protein